jgi:hypothetical protein
MAAFITETSAQKLFAEACAHVCERSRTGVNTLDLDERSTWTATSQGNISVLFVLLTIIRESLRMDRLTIGYKIKRKTVSNRIFIFGA